MRMRLIGLFVAMMFGVAVHAEDPECYLGEPPDPACDDEIDCTDDWCDAQTLECVHTEDDEECDDGIVCNGPEYCDAETGCCHTWEDPCEEGTYCMEWNGGWCSNCILDYNWDGDIDEDDFDLFDACWLEEELDCLEDVNGHLRMPSGPGEECCQFNSSMLWVGSLYSITDTDFFGFAGCYVDDPTDECDNCDGPWYDPPPEGGALWWWPSEECLHFDPHSVEDPYCSQLAGAIGPYCSETMFTQNECVECFENDHCEGSTPWCQTEVGGWYKGKCVECLEDDDCDGPWTYVCQTEVQQEDRWSCVMCTDNDDCSEMPPYMRCCNTSPGPYQFTCTGCGSR